ncbi:MAG: hypothetical protein PUG16_02165 [Lachnospiraceae bacterium]|nr:hypothetical protein [Lachnospiraceae bacterium]
MNQNKRRRQRFSRDNRGFVPAELLCVLGIIVIVIIISIPLIRNYREESRRNLDASNARSIYRTLETMMEEGRLDLTSETYNGSLWVLVQSSDSKRRLKYDKYDSLNLYLDSDQNVILHGYTGTSNSQTIGELNSSSDSSQKSTGKSSDNTNKKSENADITDELKTCFGKGGTILHCAEPNKKIKKTAGWDWYMIRFTVDAQGQVNGRIYSGSHTDTSTEPKYHKEETNIEKYMDNLDSGIVIKQTFWQVRRRTLT